MQINIVETEKAAVVERKSEIRVFRVSNDQGSEERAKLEEDHGSYRKKQKRRRLSEEELRQIYSEFAEEDLQLANSDYLWFLKLRQRVAERLDALRAEIERAKKVIKEGHLSSPESNEANAAFDIVLEKLDDVRNDLLGGGEEWR